jgi:hypothetical protein
VGLGVAVKRLVGEGIVVKTGKPVGEETGFVVLGSESCVTALVSWIGSVLDGLLLDVGFGLGETSRLAANFPDAVGFSLPDCDPEARPKGVLAETMDKSSSLALPSLALPSLDSGSSMAVICFISESNSLEANTPISDELIDVSSVSASLSDGEMDSCSTGSCCDVLADTRPFINGRLI